MLEVLQQYCTDKEFDKECKANRVSRKSPTNHGSTMANSVHNLLTPFAFKKFDMQYQEEGFYAVTTTTDGWLVQRNEEVPDTSEDLSFEELGSGEIDDGLDDTDNSRTIWFVSTDGSCPCQYKTATGIACRHTIAVSTLLYKQRLLPDPSGILGGVAIPYWHATTKLATGTLPKPQHTATHVVNISFYYFIYTTIKLSNYLKQSQ